MEKMNDKNQSFPHLPSPSLGLISPLYTISDTHTKTLMCVSLPPLDVVNVDIEQWPV